MSRNYNLLQGIGKGKQETLQSWAQPSKHSSDRSPALNRSQRESSQPVHDIQGQGWIHLLSILEKHWHLSVLFAVCVFVGVAIATLLARPVYEPAVTLEIDPPGTQALSLERSAGEGSDDAQYLE